MSRGRSRPIRLDPETYKKIVEFGATQGMTPMTVEDKSAPRVPISDIIHRLLQVTKDGPLAVNHE